MTYAGKRKDHKAPWEVKKCCRGHTARDISFTRRKLTRSCRSCCLAIASLLFFLLLTTVALYLSYLYLFRDPLKRQTFRGMFRAHTTVLDSEETPPDADYLIDRELYFKNIITNLLTASELRGSFTGTDVLALDSSAKETMVHFDLYFEPIFTPVNVDEVREVLIREIVERERANAFNNITINMDTFKIEETTTVAEQNSTEFTLPSEQTATEPIKPIELFTCEPTGLSLCSHLPYNLTFYPNLAGHASLVEIQKDLVAFRELLDAECSSLARDFVCEILQPQCQDDKAKWPCRSYCRQFHEGCGSRLPDRLKQSLDCDRFPEYFGPDSCRPAPDCSLSLQRRGLSHRICDGIVDCTDGSDEMTCGYCSPNAIKCSLYPVCISRTLRCDGKPDCPDGSDENSCLWISESLQSWTNQNNVTSLGTVRVDSGVVVWLEKGKVGKVCAESFESKPEKFKTVSTSLCHSLTFSSVVTAESIVDQEETSEYVDVEEPLSGEISFETTPCKSKKVLHVACSDLHCGLQSARGLNALRGVEGLNRRAKPGDWPWLVALYKDDEHVCDATLIAPHWLLTTSSCFQGQSKSSWMARAGTIRTLSSSPWQQERRVVGLLRSPVEGSSFALLRIDSNYKLTDLVRPICIGSGVDASIQSTVTACSTLVWSRDQLQRMHVSPTSLDACYNFTVPLTHSICAQAMYSSNDCDEEELAGSPLMCWRDSRWRLEGMSAWRVSCRQRPTIRLYDDIDPNIQWIKETITQE